MNLYDSRFAHSSFILEKIAPQPPCVVMSLNPLTQVGAAFRPRFTTVISCENNLLGYRQ